MTKIKIIPYDKSHLVGFPLQESQQGEMPLIVMSTSVTMVVEDKPIAIFGAFNFCAGVLQVWALLSDDVKKYPISFHKSCQELLLFLEHKEKPRRIQIDVRVDFERALDFAYSLGFQPEGIMKKYAKDGTDCYLFAKVAK